jgi:hypothetical protein
MLTPSAKTKEHNLNNQQQIMLFEAEIKNGKITPCGKDKTWEDCFTEYKGYLLFWFNTPDGSTKAIKQKIEK